MKKTNRLRWDGTKKCRRNWTGMFLLLPTSDMATCHLHTWSKISYISLTLWKSTSLRGKRGQNEWNELDNKENLLEGDYVCMEDLPYTYWWKATSANEISYLILPPLGISLDSEKSLMYLLKHDWSRVHAFTLLHYYPCSSITGKSDERDKESLVHCGSLPS